MVNYRATKYKTGDGLICYWNFWVDWFSFFWFDLVTNSRFVKRQIKHRNRDQRRKEKLLRKEEYKKKKLNQDIQSDPSSKKLFIEDQIKVDEIPEEKEFT